MPQTKVRILLPSLDRARTVNAVLGEAFEPAPLAVTMFEHGPVDHLVEAYFEARPDVAALQAALADAGETSPLSLTVEDVPDENWVTISQAALPPVEAGRYVVHGSHDAARVGARPNALCIDAGEAFGTAHHATTLGCLYAIDRLTRRRSYKDVLDLGTGSGVLAIAASYALPHARIAASDNDPIAVDVACQNARVNGAAGRIGFAVAQGFDHPRLRRPHAYDLIIANILANPLIRIAPDMRRAIKPGGNVVLSGLLISQAEEVFAAYRAQNFALLQRQDLTGWTILTLTAR